MTYWMKLVVSYTQIVLNNSSLKFLVKMMHIKVLKDWSNKSFDMMLDLKKKCVPNVWYQCS